MVRCEGGISPKILAATVKPVRDENSQVKTIAISWPHPRRPGTWRVKNARVRLGLLLHRAAVDYSLCFREELPCLMEWFLECLAVAIFAT